MRGTARRLLLAAGGVAVVVISVKLSGQLAQAGAWARVGAEVVESVRPRPGPWRLLRGTLHFVGIPALLALAVLVGYAGWRRDRRGAATFAVVVLVTNAVVQGLKHGQLPAPSGLNPLSGHVGLAAGLSCSWLLTSVGASVRWRRPLLWFAALVVAGTGGAVLFTGWHTLPQVLAPIGIGGGCALVGRAIGPANLPPPTTRRGGFVLIGVGVVLGFAVLLGISGIAAADPLGVALAIAALLTMVVAATSTAIGLVGVSAGRLHRGAGMVTSAN